MCDTNCTDRYPLPLCHEHVLLVWSAVDADMNVSRGELLEQRDDDEQRRRAEENQRRAHARQRPGDVYYLRVGDSIKIGHSRNLYRRMPSYPPGTQVLAVQPGTIADEQAIHHHFRAYCTSGREWYSPAPELMDHIATVQREHGTPAPDSYERRDPHRPKPGPRPKRTWGSRCG